MKTTIAQPIATCSDEPQLSALHDFNIEAVIANNFGQGDDHCPTDPMNDPRFAARIAAPGRPLL